jgi:hypothetical protein
VAGQICGRSSAYLEQKGPKLKSVSLLLSSRILGKSRKYYLPTHKDNNSVFLKPKLTESENYWGTEFFTSTALVWPKSSAKRAGNTAGKENGAAPVQQRRASLGFLDEEAKLDTEERRR